MKIFRPLAPIAVFVVLATLPAAGVRAADPLNPGSADETTAALTEADADTFFHVGETYKISNLAVYWRSYANQIPKRFDDFDALIKKAGAPDTVVADLARSRKVMTSLPWTKPWEAWNEDERKQWDDAGMDFEVWRPWLNGKNYDKLFYFYLGRESMNGWYHIEKSISDNAASLAERTQPLKDCLSSIHTLLTDSGYEHARATLSPEILAAMKEIDTLYEAVNDPLGGGAITQETVTKVGTIGKKLRDLGRTGKLLVK